jgi:hypothetical protein
VITLSALNASSGSLQDVVMPKPDPAVRLLPPGIGADPSVNFAVAFALIRSHGPSTTMAALPERKVWTELLLASIGGATFCLPTRSAYHWKACTSLGSLNAGWPDASTGCVPL